MAQRSSNTFADIIFAEGSTSFSDIVFSTGSGSFARMNKSFGGNGWSGDNLTSDPLGFDDINSGVAFGKGEFGGIKHFEAIKNRA